MAFDKLIMLMVVCCSSVGCTLVSDHYEANPIMHQQSDLLEDGQDIVSTKKLSDRVSSAESEILRNALAIDLISLSDRVCSAHQAAIIANSNTWNVATGTITNLLSGFGAVVGGEATKAALAAGAAFSSGTRSLVNEEVYVQTVGAAIVRAISIAREKYYADIQLGFEKSLSDYSVQEALRDIQEYHRRCSFYYGLLEISKSLEQRKKSKSEIDRDIENLMFRRVQLRNMGLDSSTLDSELNRLAIERVNAPN